MKYDELSAAEAAAKLSAKLNNVLSETETVTAAVQKDDSTAKWQFDYICEQIKAFESKLDNDHEVALFLTNFGQSIILNVTKISYQDPCLIYYYGTVNGQQCQLVQHISQINFLLMAVEKELPQEPPRRIGF